jgi:hypothetical protein
MERYWILLLVLAGVVVFCFILPEPHSCVDAVRGILHAIHL